MFILNPNSFYPRFQKIKDGKTIICCLSFLLYSHKFHKIKNKRRRTGSHHHMFVVLKPVRHTESLPTLASKRWGEANSMDSREAQSFTVFRIRIQIRVLLFSSLTFKTSTKTNFLKKLFCLLLFEGTFTSLFENKKIQKKSQNSWNQDFSYFFCLMIKDPDPDPYL
jgi:hypothetical protein